MPYLPVPGAELYYEAIGQGPLLVTISGANGTADIWRAFAAQLQSQFTVCIWDRRGFSRSLLNGPQDYAHRLEGDADDVAALIKHLSPNAPATVLGNSSGAIVSLMVLNRHANLLSTLIPHEPPAYALLEQPLRDECFAIQRQIYDLYRAHGPAGAFPLFMKTARMDTDADRQAMQASFNLQDPNIRANVMYWFEREVLQYVLHDHDVDKIKQAQAKLVLVNGKESHRDAPHFLTNVHLARKLGVEVEEWSGQHLGFASHPEQFAKEFVDLMQRRGTL